MPTPDYFHHSVHNIGRSYNFMLEQRNWLGFNTLMDAMTEIKFKQPGVQAYIISEDKWYYWKNDFEGFVLWTSGGTGGTDSILFSTSRNANIVVDQYLRTEDGIPTNQAPLLTVLNYNIIAISVTTDNNSTCTFEIHNNGILIPGATISLLNEKEKYINCMIGVNAGSKLMIFNRGTSNKPKVTLLLRKV